MGQIVRRKKKGRPSKADLARRAGEIPATKDPDPRRSLRRRTARYNAVDYDDDEDERRREKKKLKLVMKLNHGGVEEKEEDGTRAESRVEHAPEEESNNDGEIDGLENEGAKDEDVQGIKVDSLGLHSISGAPRDTAPSGIPLPDKRTVELILDKLQKKDTYGVFAEPVDPEELPDYHDVIEHPMDFATLRKKLANGSYPTLEQFESDVFLICSNAMQYNAPETVYHKQAQSIQELGRKKFEKLRIDFERSHFERKSEQKTRSNSLFKKQAKKPFGHASQEAVGSDFSSGATLATIANVQPTSYPIQGVSCERPGNVDGIVEGNAFLIDANLEKAEDVLSGRGMLSKLGRKSLVLDENRRASYNMSNQPITRSDSILVTFKSNMKQLVTVGLHAEYSYARSLARFTATLGPIAWKIASHRIHQALPAGCKFDRGWVGEYEPLPTPVLMLDNHVHHVQKEASLVMKLHSTTELIKGDKNCKNVEPTVEHPLNGQMFDGKPPSICPASGLASEAKPLTTAPVNLINKKQNFQSKNFDKTESKGLKQVELNCLPSSNPNISNLSTKSTSSASAAYSPTAVSKLGEMVPSNMNASPFIPFKQPDANRVNAESPYGEVMNTRLNRRVTGLSSESTSNQTGRAACFVVNGQDQSLSEPVQLMRMYAEKAQKQHTSNHSNTPSMTPSSPSRQGDDSGNASEVAAHACMSTQEGRFKPGPHNFSSPKRQVSADSSYNLPKEFHHHISRTWGQFSSGGMSFQPDKNNSSFQALVPQPIPKNAISQCPNQSMVFPQPESSDLSRFQMQAPRQGLSPHSQPTQKQETLPPDLNIGGFQSPGSPAKQSSGVLVDSQQPELALQL